jgi:transposase
MLKQRNKISFEGQNLFVGIDSHLKQWRVTVVSDSFEYKTVSIDAGGSSLYKFLRNNFPDGNYQSAYEASFNGFSSHYEIESYGIKNIVVNPADIPTTDKEKRQKEDIRDSRKIASMLRSGNLTPIFIPSKEILGYRTLVRYRRSIVTDISRQKAKVKFLLYNNGVRIPIELASSSISWSKKYVSWLKNLELNSVVKFTLLSYISYMEQLKIMLKKINKEVIEFANNSSYSKMIGLLRTVPGIGLIVAVTFITEIGDILRFSNIDKLNSFIGFIPTTNSSGEQERTGRITKRSNKYLRKMLIEAAWKAKSLDNSLACSYSRLTKRLPANKAVIRIAKKLVSRIKYVLTNNVAYEYGKI